MDIVERLAAAKAEIERLRADNVMMANALSKEIGTEHLDEIARLRLENWQLKGALGYPVPGDIPPGDFRCGMCEARVRRKR